MPKQVSSRRLWFISGIVSLLFLVLVYQLVQLAVIRQPSLLEVAHKQHDITVRIPPFRGPILDRHGKELATNLKMPSVYAVPRAIRRFERESLIGNLQDILGLERAFLKERLTRDKAFIWIRRLVKPEEAVAIKGLEHNALGIVEEYKRFYPQGDLLSQVLGFTNIDTMGLEGIELAYEKQLKGREGKRLSKRDALGREIRAFTQKTVPAIDGHRVVLTIDQYLQYLTETALDEAFKKWNAKGATAILMNPHTGEILAMANRPGFDPNDFQRSDLESRRNRSITDVYEPGSVFKVIAASAALNEGVTDRNQLYFCENGAWQYGSKTLHDVHEYGDLSFEEVIVKSSNIGTVKIAQQLDPDVFYRYMKSFGIAEKTGVDMVGEVSGFVRPPSKWSKTSPYNIPMGHEVLVTALQMTRVFSVIANGGKLVRPYMLDHIEDQKGVRLEDNSPEVVRQVIKPEVAAVMREILVRVVDEGTGKRAAIDGIRVAGKTGTAQKVLSGGRGYSHDKFISSFVGFAPAESPLLVMGVVLDDPGPRYYGGTVAAPVFKKVMEQALYHLGHVPENETVTTVVGLSPAAQDNQPRPQSA